MRKFRWWQYGLVGGIALSVATLVKVIRAIVRGAAADADWTEALGFAVFIFGMGFGCGLVVWIGRGLSQRFGLVGDAIVGMAVMLVFFTACMAMFAPDFLGPKLWSGGLPMYALGSVVGLIGGAWVGRDLRKELKKQESEGRGDSDEVDDRFHKV